MVGQLIRSRVRWTQRLLLPASVIGGVVGLGLTFAVLSKVFGILLLRVADPELETTAADAFGYKQLLHEPFMGGGLWTSTVIPLLYIFRANPWPIWWITLGAIGVWLIVRFVIFRRAWAPERP